MENSFGPSRFGVKFWIGAAALLSVTCLLDLAIITAHAKARHADFWLINGAIRFMALAIVWGACIQCYRQIRKAAMKSSASEDLALNIQYWTAMTLSSACVALGLLIVSR